MHGSSAALQGVSIIKGAKINSGNKPSSEQKRSVLPDRERLELARSSGHRGPAARSSAPLSGFTAVAHI